MVIKTESKELNIPFIKKKYNQKYQNIEEAELFFNEVSKMSGEEKKNLIFEIDEDGTPYIIDSKYNIYEWSR